LLLLAFGASQQSILLPGLGAMIANAAGRFGGCMKLSCIWLRLHLCSEVLQLADNEQEA
jgi:hypothetical protein